MSARIACLSALAVWLLAGCAATIYDPKRVGNPQAAPQSLVLIWSAAKAPTLNNFPALGASWIGTPASEYWRNYESEFRALGGSLAEQLPAVVPLPTASFVALDVRHDKAELDAAIAAARPDSAVVLLYPEEVLSYCTAGCYAFRVRVNYLSPVSRRLVWTGIVVLPPKRNHHDPFGPRALDFVTTLNAQLGQEGLLPPIAGEPAPASDPRTTLAPSVEHRKQVPAPTGFARTDETSRLPVRPEGRDRFLHYLTLPSPKAFAVSAAGGWRFFSGDPDVMTRALDRCARDGATCWLYAVDDQIVWDAAPERRIGSRQLVDR